MLNGFRRKRQRKKPQLRHLPTVGGSSCKYPTPPMRIELPVRGQNWTFALLLEEPTGTAGLGSARTLPRRAPTDRRRPSSLVRLLDSKHTQPALVRPAVYAGTTAGTVAAAALAEPAQGCCSQGRAAKPHPPWLCFAPCACRQGKSEECS